MGACGNLTLKSCQKRRLAAEQAIYMRYNSFADCAKACQELSDKKALGVTFNTLSIQQYVGCQTNLSMKRLKILAELLNITNYAEMDDVYVAPLRRGFGDYWVSARGNKVKDIDMSALIRAGLN